MIVGDAVLLRLVEHADIELIREWRNSPEVARYHADRDPISQAKQEAWYRSISTDPSKFFTVLVEAKQGRPIGVVHLKDIDLRHRRAEAGIYVADLRFRGNIYAMEALFLMLDYAFATMNLHKIYGHYLDDNTTARRHNEAFGFVEEGVFRDEVYYDGTYHDYVRIGLLADEFYASSGAQFFVRRRERNTKPNQGRS